MSCEIYDSLGPDGLAARTTEAADQCTVERIDGLLRECSQRNPHDLSLLDAGCGYGRIAIPLAGIGYQVTGIDINAAMLSAAKTAETSAVASQPIGDLQTPITWRLGDIGLLPFPDASFDVVLCMWLTFNELLQFDEQVNVLKEMMRVLKPGGWCLIDGPPYMERGDSAPTAASLGERTTPFSEVSMEKSTVGQCFLHLADQAGIQKHRLLVDDCPGRWRYFFQFWRVGVADDSR